MTRLFSAVVSATGNLTETSQGLSQRLRNIYSGFDHVFKANLKLFGLFLVWARAPFFVASLFALWRNANLAGGFAGRFGWFFFGFLFVLM